MIAQTDKVLWQSDEAGDWLKIRVNNPRALCEGLQDGKTYDVEIKTHRERRSLDANAFLWVLIGKLAKHYNLPSNEVYRQFVRMVGAFEVLPVREDIADRWPSIWGSNGVGFIVDDLGPSKLKGYRNFKCYYGSHVYDTQEMSRLIDSVVEECKLAHIETLSPDKVRGLMEDWNAPRNQSKANPG